MSFNKCVQTLVFTALLVIPASLSVLADDRPSVDVLVNFFDTIVFGNEQEPDRQSFFLAHWGSPISYTITGEPTSQHLEILKRHMATISSLTNLTFEPTTPSSGVGDMTFIFVTAQQMSQLTFNNVNADLVKSASRQRTCYFLFAKNPPQRIIRSFVAINRNREINAVTHCLLEELVQSLGLPNDTSILRPSLFSDEDQLGSMARHDEIILRTLYDQRMRKGLNRADALILAREIIAEWDGRLPYR